MGSAWLEVAVLGADVGVIFLCEISKEHLSTVSYQVRLPSES